MWLIEKNGKRIENKELQDFLEKNGQDLPPVSYTELSGEDLERKVNDSWKEGVNYLTGQKVTGASGGVLRTSAYIASGKDVMDDTGLTDMALGLGFSIAAIRNKAILTEKGNAPKVTKDPQMKKAGKLKTKTNKLHLPDQLSEMSRRIRQNIEASQKAREASNLKEYLKKEKAVLEKIKKASGAEFGKITEFPKSNKKEMLENLPDGWTYTEHNGRIHIKDKNGEIRVRTDPPDKTSEYPHMHIFDEKGNPLDKNGNIVDRKSPEAHIPWSGK